MTTSPPLGCSAKALSSWPRVEGSPAGVAWGALAPTRLAGEDGMATYFFHLRITPEHQRKGLWGALDSAVSRVYGERTDVWVGYYMIENVAWSHVAKQVQSRADFVPREWVPTVYRLLMPTAELAGPPSGRSATPDDAGHIAALLNAFHEREEFYAPYTAESLAARLERDDGYSWNQVRVSDDAVLGVWPAGRTIDVITERDGSTTRSRRGHVMDYAYRPGAEQAFSEMLGACAADLLASGIDSLSLFTSEGSFGYDLLADFNAVAEGYRFNTGTSAMVPDTARKTGIYTDHLYF
jgi:hypothetical protein